MEKPKDTFIDDTLAVRLGLQYNDKEDSFEGCKNGNTISVKQPSDGMLSIKFSLNIEKMTNGELLGMVSKLEDFYNFNVTQKQYNMPKSGFEEDSQDKEDFKDYQFNSEDEEEVVCNPTAL